MRGFIGVTDDQWFAFLACLDSIDIVLPMACCFDQTCIGSLIETK